MRRNGVLRAVTTLYVLGIAAVGVGAACNERCKAKMASAGFNTGCASPVGAYTHSFPFRST
jgi:hypothetical protein